MIRSQLFSFSSSARGKEDVEREYEWCLSSLYPQPQPVVITSMIPEPSKNTCTRRRQSHLQFGHTRFEWIQLVATLAVPIAIGVFTVINSIQQMDQSKNQFDVQLKIAGENRKKDLAIADENRKNDLLIAEVQIRIAADNRENDIRIASERHSNEQHIAAENRRKDIGIASENRRKDFKIAEENRLKDFAVTEDQQKHQILTEYQTFLTELLLKEGIHLNNTNNKEAAQFVARFKTLVVFRHLDPKRRSLLFKSLYEGRLAGRLDGEIVIDISSADLSGIDFASPRHVVVLTPPSLHQYYSLNFSYTNLKNASFNSVSFFNVSFNSAIMDDTVMLSTLTTLITFIDASLVRTKFLYSYYISINFTDANMDNVSFDQFECERCHFFRNSLFYCQMQNSKFCQSTFDSVQMNGCLLQASELINSNMTNVSLNSTQLHNCTLSNVDLRHCTIFDASLLDSTLLDVNLYGCEGLTDEQLFQAKSLKRLTLPNGTVITRDKRV